MNSLQGAFLIGFLMSLGINVILFYSMYQKLESKIYKYIKLIIQVNQQRNTKVFDKDGAIPEPLVNPKTRKVVKKDDLTPQQKRTLKVITGKEADIFD